MVPKERDMIRKLDDEESAASERVTSLQPTYEDSVAPGSEDSDWDDDRQ